MKNPDAPYIIVAAEAGESFNSNYREEAARNDDCLFEALTRLQARVVQVGREVLTLLNRGFADGAHARWRTAHEIAVVANFLASNGGNAAKRYLEHEIIESYKIMIQYEEYPKEWGYERYSEKELSEVKEIRDRLCAQYGKEFKTEYGWATEALSNKEPKFYDIEKASGLNHWRPYYKMASHNVHAGPKGIYFRLGLAEGEDLLLACPSNYGLAEPAIGVAISILQATAPMLVSKMTIDSLVIGKIMAKFVHDIGNAFSEADRAIKSRHGY